jgi:hypothetical protein
MQCHCAKAARYENPMLNNIGSVPVCRHSLLFLKIQTVDRRGSIFAKLSSLSFIRY